jgi:hypothetical protein
MSDYLTAKGTIIRETELAFLFVQDRDGEKRESWIPRSECKRISKRLNTDETISAVIELPEWLAEAKELEVEP